MATHPEVSKAIVDCHVSVLPRVKCGERHSRTVASRGSGKALGAFTAVPPLRGPPNYSRPVFPRAAPHPSPAALAHPLARRGLDSTLRPPSSCLAVPSGAR